MFSRSKRNKTSRSKPMAWHIATVVGPKQTSDDKRVINISALQKRLWVGFCPPELTYSILAAPRSRPLPQLPSAASVLPPRTGTTPSISSRPEPRSLCRPPRLLPPRKSCSEPALSLERKSLRLSPRWITSHEHTRVSFRQRQRSATWPNTRIDLYGTEKCCWRWSIALTQSPFPF